MSERNTQADARSAFESILEIWENNGRGACSSPRPDTERGTPNDLIVVVATGATAAALRSTIDGLNGIAAEAEEQTRQRILGPDPNP